MKKHNGGIILTTLFLVSAIIFASGAIAVYTVFMKPEGKSEIPNFRDKSTVDAVAEAERLGLVVQLEQAASTLPEGIVLAQSPQEGSELRKGQVIVLQVSKGGELHAVPDVQGMTLTEAQKEIKAQGFALGDVVKVREPKVKAGEVIAQNPAAPSKVPAGKKIDLLVQDGADASGVITVPDVNRMTEKEAREVLTAAGLKIQGVDKVYSPLLPEGLAIETRPGTGSTLRAGQGVILKLATQRRPAGFMDSKSNTSSTANGTARRVTSQQNQDTKPQAPKPQTENQTQSAPPKTAETPPPSPAQQQEEEFIGDDYTPAPAKTAQTQPKTSAPSQPKQTQQSTQKTSSSGGSKTANIRYVVPPIARPMNLRIEVTDPSGKRDVMNKQVRSGESISTNVRYSKECVVTIYLGGEFVWQERKN
ncbi:MAG: PASTA domain-containing protein [Synergistaceae bacterium]|nr:PASTA domain-containing protein [Synergistaceae bacterium]